MGLRFRKSIKIAKGVRVNLNKKSVGVTIGGKGAKVSINSSGRKSATVGIPGSGLSYTANLSDKKTKKYQSDVALPDVDTSDYKAKPAPSSPWYRSYVKSYVIGFIFVAIWRIMSGLMPTASVVALLFGIIMLIRGIAGHRISKKLLNHKMKLRMPPIFRWKSYSPF
ncbi:MAG: DUF4236 domain-containing protein [Eubacteriales bacterium]|nr:DUF4236 domain-containing protein [Eubacteriales bacterium]